HGAEVGQDHRAGSSAVQAVDVEGEVEVFLGGGEVAEVGEDHAGFVGPASGAVVAGPGLPRCGGRAVDGCGRGGQGGGGGGAVAVVRGGVGQGGGVVGGRAGVVEVAGVVDAGFGETDGGGVVAEVDRLDGHAA